MHRVLSPAYAVSVSTYAFREQQQQQLLLHAIGLTVLARYSGDAFLDGATASFASQCVAYLPVRVLALLVCGN